MKKRRFKKSKRLLQTACLAVGLTLAGWSGGPAVDQAAAAAVVPTIEVSGTISPATSLTDVWVIYSLNSSSGDSIYSHEAADVTGGSVGNFSFQVQDPSWYDSESYTVIGVYDESGNGTGDSVCIGGPGISAGNSWSTYFSSDAESTVVGWLQGDNSSSLEDFYSTNFDTIAQDIGSDINLWNFSDATNNGTAHADSRVVPIPGAVWLLGSGLFGLVAIRRRKKS